MPSVAPLSFKSDFGYYGLRVNPTFDELLQTVRNPHRIPIPDRRAKWLALGPYRNFIEDAERAYNESIYNATDYRESGAHLPLSAAIVTASMAGQDRTFDHYHVQGESLNQQEALEAAFEHFNREARQRTDTDRREHLRRIHGSNSTHPTVYAHHDELREAGVHHWIPAPRPAPSSSSWQTPTRNMAAAGHPQAPQFTEFGVLNRGQPSSFRPGVASVTQNPTYERMRDPAQGWDPRWDW